MALVRGVTQTDRNEVWQSLVRSLKEYISILEADMGVYDGGEDQVFLRNEIVRTKKYLKGLGPEGNIEEVLARTWR